MKVKKETKLFTVPFGSHLYGTNVEGSDHDYKVVCLPSLDTLLLNKKLVNRQEAVEGTDGKVEYEFLPLQVLLDDFFNGQTYALEVVHAALQDKVTVFSDNHGLIELMLTELTKFTTSGVEKMVGYAVSQSRKYGLKTERYTSLKNCCTILSAGGVEWHGQTLEQVAGTVAALLKLPHVKPAQLENAAGGSELAPAIDICGKKFPLTNTVGTVIKSLEKSLDTYGDRVKQFDGEGIDWKALMHAIRITEQVLELAQTGRIVFPRPNASYLRAVREGKFELEQVLSYLTWCFNSVESATSSSTLAPRTSELEEKFTSWKLGWLRRLYCIGQ